jgi:hypothetical protein
MSMQHYLIKKVYFHDVHFMKVEMPLQPLANIIEIHRAVLMLKLEC